MWYTLYLIRAWKYTQTDLNVSKSKKQTKSSESIHHRSLPFYLNWVLLCPCYTLATQSSALRRTHLRTVCIQEMVNSQELLENMAPHCVQTRNGKKSSVLKKCTCESSSHCVYTVRISDGMKSQSRFGHIKRGRFSALIKLKLKRLYNFILSALSAVIKKWIPRHEPGDEETEIIIF